MVSCDLLSGEVSLAGRDDHHIHTVDGHRIHSWGHKAAPWEGHVREVLDEDGAVHESAGADIPHSNRNHHHRNHQPHFHSNYNRIRNPGRNPVHNSHLAADRHTAHRGEDGDCRVVVEVVGLGRDKP